MRSLHRFVQILSVVISHFMLGLGFKNEPELDKPKPWQKFWVRLGMGLGVVALILGITTDSISLFAPKEEESKVLEKMLRKRLQERKDEAQSENNDASLDHQ